MDAGHRTPNAKRRTLDAGSPLPTIVARHTPPPAVARRKPPPANAPPSLHATHRRRLPLPSRALVRAPVHRLAVFPSRPVLVSPSSVRGTPRLCARPRLAASCLRSFRATRHRCLPSLSVLLPVLGCARVAPSRARIFPSLLALASLSSMHASLVPRFRPCPRPPSRFAYATPAVFWFARRQLRKLSFKLINSSTLLLPQWRGLLKELGLKERNIPRDVRTRWNSTHDLLKFCIEYQVAIDKITADKDTGLRSLELTKDEWIIVKDVCRVLEVRFISCFFPVCLLADYPV